MKILSVADGVKTIGTALYLVYQFIHSLLDLSLCLLPDGLHLALEGLDEENNYRVVFAHRVDPDRVIRTTIDNKPLELHPSRYGEAGWNLPNIKYWLDLELPKKV